jgi:hypothetical protein
MREFDCEAEAYCLPDLRADGGVRTVRLTPRGVRIERTVAGIKMRFAIPLEVYQSIQATRDEDRRFCRIRLAHRDPDLSVSLDQADASAWQHWLCLLPALALRTAPAKRRRSATLAKRRPRVLSRRQPGRLRIPAKVLRGARELFSRE